MTTVCSVAHYSLLLSVIPLNTVPRHTLYVREYVCMQVCFYTQCVHLFNLCTCTRTCIQNRYVYIYIYMCVCDTLTLHIWAYGHMSKPFNSGNDEIPSIPILRPSTFSSEELCHQTEAIGRESTFCSRNCRRGGPEAVVRESTFFMAEATPKSISAIN